MSTWFRRQRASVVGELWRMKRLATLSMRSLRIRDNAGPAIPTYAVFGSPRSGTTWLAEVMNRRGDHRLMFEPLIPYSVPTLRIHATPKLDPLKVPYLQPDLQQSDLLRLFGELIEGRIKDPWMDQFNVGWLPSRRILKETFANGLVPWIAKNFPSLPILVVVRHPIAVAASRHRLGTPSLLARYCDHPELAQRYLQPVFVRTLVDDLSVTVAQWAVETVLPLSANSQPSVKIVAYERLCTDEQVLSGALAHVDQDWDSSVEGAAQVRSRTSYAHRRAHERRLVTRDERREVDRILDHFGLRDYYQGGSDEPGTAFERLTSPREE